MNGSFYSNPNPSSQRPINYKSQQMKAFIKRNAKRLMILALVLIALTVIWNECFFVVGEAEQAVVSRFGVIKRLVLNSGNDFHQRYAQALKDEITLSGSVDIHEGSGLQFKLPFVDKVQTYPARLFTYTSESEVVNTQEKKQYYITTFAQWSITDPALFSLKLGSMTSAENQLDNIIHPVIVQAINRMLADDFISNKDALNAVLLQGLDTINQDMCLRGIEVKDIQIHRTILPPANIESTYARMQADRAKVAQQLRSEGQEAYLKAVAAADLEARVIEADAVSKAGAIRGDGDAQALTIYAEAYSQDPEFYSYWRSLQALESAIDESSVLILDQEHPLWKDLLAFTTQK